MKIGFFTAPLTNMSLDDLLKWGKEEGFQALEISCWPRTYKKRRYAGNQHISVEELTISEASEINGKFKEYNLDISSLGYYPNYLEPDPKEADFSKNHLKKVIKAASLLGVDNVGTFIGRDSKKNLKESLKDFKRVFTDLVKYAEDYNVKIAIENCPMLWEDRWPGGNNLASSPEIWALMFELIPSKNLGLNFDPSHLVWQFIDYVQAVYDFRDRIYHVHAKDTRIMPDILSRVGARGFGFYKDKVAGLGDINWKKFISALYEIKYQGVVSIENEDRDFEGEESAILKGIKLGKKLISQYIVDYPKST